MNDLSEWLRLYHVDGIGPSKFARLIEHFGCPSQVLSSDETTLKQVGLSNKLINNLLSVSMAGVEQDLAWLASKAEHHILTLNDPLYPNLLREIPGDPPPLLYIKGNPLALHTPQLAVIGSRNPSPTGQENAYHFSKSLAQQGITITSGLALGIDAICHKGALAGAGITLAVCATGLDITYPKSNFKLAQTILEQQGALVSEFPISTPPKKENFPRRNRIISGLSLGTLVIEAALRSGSLITARYAAEQNREVFAIPGSIHNPLARGCHLLIKQGAKLTESVEDILEEIAFSATKTIYKDQPLKESFSPPITLSTDSLAVLDGLSHEPTSVDTLIRRTGLTADAVSSILLELELRRYITSTPGGSYSRKR